MKVDNIEVIGIERSHRAMRNPKNSWDRSDEQSDLILSQQLYRGGSEHSKHLRMIKVYMDIDAPRYFWQEFDTYKIGVEKVSCSTMHKLFDREIEVDDFSVENENDKKYLKMMVDNLNIIRIRYIMAKKNNNQKLCDELLIRAKRLLPESYRQKRTVVVDIQQLINIIQQRKNHRLPEWRKFCEIILENVDYIGKVTMSELSR